MTSKMTAHCHLGQDKEGWDYEVYISGSNVVVLRFKCDSPTIGAEREEVLVCHVINSGDSAHAKYYEEIEYWTKKIKGGK